MSKLVERLIFGLPTSVMQATPAMEHLLERGDGENNKNLDALIRGLIYTGGGYAATRLLFPPLGLELQKKEEEAKTASLRGDVPMKTFECYLIKRALLDPIGMASAYGHSDAGDPDTTGTVLKGGLYGAGGGLLGSLGGAAAGGLSGAAIGAAINLLSKGKAKVPVSESATRGGVLGITPGAVGGGLYGAYKGGKSQAYKKPAENKPTEKKEKKEEKE